MSTNVETPSANPHKRHTGLARVLCASGHSAAGLRAAYRGESAFRQEFWLAAVLIPAAFWVARDAWHVALLVSATLLVLIVELLNSAIEAVVDRISLELHPLSKAAKDYGSAAVALALLACGALWAVALWQRFA